MMNKLSSHSIHKIMAAAKSFALIVVVQIFPIACIADTNNGVDAYKRGDYVKAARELQAASKQGDTDAQVLLGYMYDQGLGVSEDHAEAAHWYLRAAEKGDPIAQLNIGIMYGEGDGVDRDLMQAYHWFDRAASTFQSGAEHDDAISKRELARSLMSAKQRRQIEAFSKPPANVGTEQ